MSPIALHGHEEAANGSTQAAAAPSTSELTRLTELTSKLQELIQTYGALPSSNGDLTASTSHIQAQAGAHHHASSRLDGKVAIVTGAGRGIGAGVAQELAARGASVIVNYASSDERAQSVVDAIASLGGRAHAIKADVSDVSQITRLFDETVAHFGGVDIVVSNSGMEDFTPTLDVTPEQFDRVFGLNCRAQFFVGQHAFRYCRPGGRVVLMSSIAAGIMGPANHSLYAGSKNAIEGFTRTMAFDFGKRGITVNAIAPGGIKSDMFAHAAWRYIPGADKSWSADRIETAMAGACPLGRCALPIDVARVVCFLASQDGEWVNGQTIRISGGSSQ